MVSAYITWVDPEFKMIWNLVLSTKPLPFPTHAQIAKNNEILQHTMKSIELLSELTEKYDNMENSVT